MKLRILKKSIPFIIVLAIITIIFLSFYQFPKKIDIIVSAVSFYENDSTSTQQTLIKVSGVLYQPLFKQHKFKGKIIIDNLEFTKEKETFDIYITEKIKGINVSSLTYYKQVKLFDSYDNLGLIWFDDSFEHINIGTRLAENKDLIYYIVSGSSYDEALETQKMMRNRFGRYFVPNE